MVAEVVLHCGYGVVLYIVRGGDSWISAALLGEARPPRPCRDNIFLKEFRKHFKVFKVALLVAVLMCMSVWYSNNLIVLVV